MNREIKQLKKQQNNSLSFYFCQLLAGFKPTLVNSGVTLNQLMQKLHKFKTKKMAGIDKIYITGDQLYSFYEWIKNSYKKCTKDTGFFMKHYLYYSISDAKKIKIKPKEYIPVSNFPSEIDLWILRQNDVPDFIMNKVKEQYGFNQN